MESWTWGEFLSVWIPICIILDVIFIAMEKFGSKATKSQEEERRQKTKSLNTQFKDNVSYNMESKALSMRTVENLQTKMDEEASLEKKKEVLPEPTTVEGETVDTVDDDEEEYDTEEAEINSDMMTAIQMTLANVGGDVKSRNSESKSVS